MVNETFSFKIGDYQCLALSDSTLEGRKNLKRECRKVKRRLFYLVLIFVFVMLVAPYSYAQIRPIEPQVVQPRLPQIELLGRVEVPVEVYRMAADHVEEANRSEYAPDWKNAHLSGVVWVYYRPDIEGIAYYEFEVVPGGFVVVSTGDHDSAIPHWDFTGPPIGRLLEEQAAESRRKIERMYKLDAFYYVGEDEKGEKVAEVGNRLVRVDGLTRDLLDVDEEQYLGMIMTGPEKEARDDDAENVEHVVLREVEPKDVPVEIGRWSSWKELKRGYADVYDVFIEAQRREVHEEWKGIEMLREKGTMLNPGEETRRALLFPEATYKIDGEGARYVKVERVERREMPPLLRIIVDVAAKEDTPFTLHITYGNQQSEELRYFIASNHTNSQTWWAGGSFNQCWYHQFAYGDCPVGCGPVAWAMLFGWADRQAEQGSTYYSYWQGKWGIYRQNGGYGPNAVAPRFMDDGIRNIIQEINDHVGTFCLWGGGATRPWTMWRAYYYFIGRSSISMRTRWNAAFLPSRTCRRYARDSIKDRNTPAVVGFGWAPAHYALAYGYYEKSRWWRPNKRRFYVNQGHGGSRGWISARLWFSGEISPDGSY